MKFIRKIVIVTTFVILTMLLFSCAVNSDKKNEDVKTESETKTEETKINEYLTIPEGDYQDRIGQRATMNVKFKDQIYYFEINWSNSAFDSSRWTFSGRYDVSIGGVYYKDSRSVTLEYDNDDPSKDPMETEVYTLGTGVMKLENNLLYWKDDQEGTLEKRDYCAVFERVVEGHTNTIPNVTNNYYYNNYPYPNNYSNYNPGYNPYQVPMDTYGYSQNGMFVIPYNSYYYISGYDRNAYSYYNGQPMASRVPILSGNYAYPTSVANGLLYNAYMSMRKWCNDYVAENDKIQDYYLNFASIESETPTQVVLIVNCALQRKGALDGNIEFRVTLNIQGNRYTWRKLGNNGGYSYKDAEIYEFDSTTGQIIIVR